MATVRGGMGGKLAIQKMSEFEPGVRAIIATGYSNDPTVQSFRDYGFVGAITKPFTLMTLKTIIHDVLAGANRRGNRPAPPWKNA